ncbi:hypothetical protein [Francisella sp. TX07-6608]|uniref:hypothetical protein n=1 Tax=Francisella sp. TX07-6608 TaxID=573568 RepID=UPI0008F9892F|nr:hypothetical protein [Francisella sp. TX07-6608]OIN85124.1 hypothetical protein KX00_2137 [Francisella sp. TX07-6608]
MKGLGVTKNEFLAQCYNNLAEDKPNQELVVACQSGNQVLHINQRYSRKLQSSYEIIRQANLDYKAFCNDFATSNLLNPNLDKYEQHLLMEKICHTEQSDTSKHINNGDIVYKDNQLFKKTAKGYIPYNKKISDGLIVYKINTPVSLYIAKNNELIPAQNGDQVIKNHQTYVVNNNKLVKYQV